MRPADSAALLRGKAGDPAGRALGRVGADGLQEAMGEARGCLGAVSTHARGQQDRLNALVLGWSAPKDTDFMKRSDLGVAPSRGLPGAAPL